MSKSKVPEPEAFSAVLEKWLKKRGKKTLLELNEVFGEKTFAVTFIIMMALPALPIPTGGVTHLTELVTMILSLEMMAGRKSIWLPKWLLRRVNVGTIMKGKPGHKLIGVIKWFERWSRRRWSFFLVHPMSLSLIGLVIFIYTLAAFAAPPFSGLDTLPALGVVVMSLAIILEDSLFLLLGLAIGAGGIAVEIATGAELYKGFKHFL